jgi:hypothetical protein
VIESIPSEARFSCEQHKHKITAPLSDAPSVGGAKDKARRVPFGFERLISLTVIVNDGIDDIWTLPHHPGLDEFTISNTLPS